MRLTSNKFFVIYAIFSIYMVGFYLISQDPSSLTNQRTLLGTFLPILTGFMIAPLLSHPRGNLLAIPATVISLLVVPLFFLILHTNNIWILALTLALTLSSLTLPLWIRRNPMLSLVTFVFLSLSYLASYITLVREMDFPWEILASVPLLSAVPVIQDVNRRISPLICSVLAFLGSSLLSNQAILYLITHIWPPGLYQITLYVLIATLTLTLFGFKTFSTFPFIVLSALAYLLFSPSITIISLVTGSSLTISPESIGIRIEVTENRIIIRAQVPKSKRISLRLDGTPLNYRIVGDNLEAIVSDITPGDHLVETCVESLCVKRTFKVQSKQGTLPQIRIDHQIDGKTLRLTVRLASVLDAKVTVKVNGEDVSLTSKERGKYVGEYELRQPGNYVVEAIANLKDTTLAASKEIEVRGPLDLDVDVQDRWPELFVRVSPSLGGRKVSVDKLWVRVNGEEMSFSNPDVGVYEAIFGPTEAKTYTVEVEGIRDGMRAEKKIMVQVRPPSLRNWDPGVWIGKTIYGYEISSVLGVGGTSYVLLGVREGKKYAIKIPTVSPSSSSSLTRVGLGTFSDLSKESSKLQEISERSGDIVKLYGVYADVNSIRDILGGKPYLYLTNPPAIVMELMKGGTAEDLLKITQVSRSKEWRLIVMEILRRMASALQVVHSEGYVHLDVKPRNIFFSSPPGGSGEEVLNNLRSGSVQVKLGDLGSARRIGEKITEYTGEYCPVDQVESMLLGTGAKPEMDVYALGATIYKLLTRNPLNPPEMVKEMDSSVDAFLDRRDYRSHLDRARKVYSEHYQKIRVVDQDSLMRLILKMVSPDPSARPPMRETLDQLRLIKD